MVTTNSTTQPTQPTQPTSRKPLLIAGVAALIIGLVALGVVAMRLAGQQGARPTVGSPAPNFTLTAFPGYDGGLGEKITLADLKGKVVVVNFWGSWCIECHKEAADLEATYLKYKSQDVVFIGIDWLDTERPALDYLAQYNITYANGFDTQSTIAKQYRITGAPETFIIDKQGIVRETIIQPISAARLGAMIDKVLGD
jgi:cytochrome c biogenesis protein CcmG/thiol:disulfide interchange protein DsbE